MAKTSKRPSPAEWAETHPRRAPGRTCWICARPEARKVVDEFLAMGDRCPSQFEIARYLAEFMDCPLKAVTIGQHIRTHGDR